MLGVSLPGLAAGAVDPVLWLRARNDNIIGQRQTRSRSVHVCHLVLLEPALVAAQALFYLFGRLIEARIRLLRACFGL